MRPAHVRRSDPAFAARYMHRRRQLRASWDWTFFHPSHHARLFLPTASIAVAMDSAATVTLVQEQSPVLSKSEPMVPAVSSSSTALPAPSSTKRLRSRFSRFTTPVSLLSIPFLFAFVVTFVLSSREIGRHSRAKGSLTTSTLTATHCSPEQWSQGKWVRKEAPRFVVWGQAAPGVPDFEQCGDEDSEWRWEPAVGCSMGQFSKEEMVRDLVERGGWLLIGDSLTATQMFSMSCMLSPYVIKGSRTSEGAIDVSLPHELFLDPSSSLISSLALPEGFSLTETPLISFYRSDLLFHGSELKALHSSLPPFSLPGDSSKFIVASSAESAAVTSKLIQSHIDVFITSSPRNYRAMIVSTGDKWSPSMFGLEGGNAELLWFFEMAMKNWVSLISEGLGEARAAGGDEVREVIVRSYAAADEDIQEGLENDREVGMAGRMNQIFESLVYAQGDPHIRFLDIMAPASSPRGTNHIAPADCLNTRECLTGVVQGLTSYLHHFLAELP